MPNPDKDERKPLTDTEAEYYNALVFFIKEHGYPPSVRELADILDKSQVTVMETFDRLADKNWVNKTEGINRGTIPTGFKYGIDKIPTKAPNEPYSFD